MTFETHRCVKMRLRGSEPRAPMGKLTVLPNSTQLSSSLLKHGSPIRSWIWGRGIEKGDWKGLAGMGKDGEGKREGGVGLEIRGSLPSLTLHCVTLGDVPP